MVATVTTSFKFLGAFTIIFLLFHMNFESEVGYTNIRCKEREREALVAFKDSLVDESDWLCIFIGNEDT